MRPMPSRTTSRITPSGACATRRARARPVDGIGFGLAALLVHPAGDGGGELVVGFVGTFVHASRRLRRRESDQESGSTTGRPAAVPPLPPPCGGEGGGSAGGVGP